MEAPGPALLSITEVRFERTEPLKTVKTVPAVKSGMKTRRRPFSGAAHEYQTEPPPQSGSPASRVAPRVQPMMVEFVPVRTVASAKSSFGGGTFVMTRERYAEAVAPRLSTACACKVHSPIG